MRMESTAAILLCMVPGTAALCFPAPSLVSYTYDYPHGAPVPCCGGYYDDPGRNILNNGDLPDVITKRNTLTTLGYGTGTCVARQKLPHASTRANMYLVYCHAACVCFVQANTSA